MGEKLQRVVIARAALIRVLLLAPLATAALVTHAGASVPRVERSSSAGHHHAQQRQRSPARSHTARRCGPRRSRTICRKDRPPRGQPHPRRAQTRRPPATPPRTSSPTAPSAPAAPQQPPAASAPGAASTTEVTTPSEPATEPTLPTGPIEPTQPVEPSPSVHSSGVRLRRPAPKRQKSRVGRAFAKKYTGNVDGSLQMPASARTRGINAEGEYNNVRVIGGTIKRSGSSEPLVRFKAGETARSSSRGCFSTAAA